MSAISVSDVADRSLGWSKSTYWSNTMVNTFTVGALTYKMSVTLLDSNRYVTDVALSGTQKRVGQQKVFDEVENAVAYVYESIIKHYNEGGVNEIGISGADIESANKVAKGSNQNE